MNSTMRTGLLTLALPAALALSLFGSAGVPAGRQDAGAPQAGASNRTQDLIGHLQERARLVPWDATAHLKLGQAYLDRARETADPTYYTKAEGVLQRALELRPDDSAAMAALGDLALARHQFEEALVWGQRAREVNPDLAAAYGVMGDALVELGRYPEAFATFQQMVDRRPDLSSYARVSYARELSGDYDSAIVAMQTAAHAGGAIGEPVAWTRTQLGDLIRVYREDRPAAAREYRAALETRPGYGPALAGLARLAATPSEACDLARQAFDALPSLDHAVLLGEALRGAGREEEAVVQDALVAAIRALNESAGVGPEPRSRR